MEEDSKTFQNYKKSRTKTQDRAQEEIQPLD